MTDDELLKSAQGQLKYSHERHLSQAERELSVQRSIAASLLVIARNSLPVTVNKVVEVGIDLAKPGGDKSVNYHDWWIAKRLNAYQKYWSQARLRYEIEEEWKPTKDELLADLEDAYNFEHDIGRNIPDKPGPFKTMDIPPPSIDDGKNNGTGEPYVPPVN